MGKDDSKFILALLFTVVLGVLVIIGEGRREQVSGQGEVVDMQAIHKLVDQGLLSLHPAEFYKEVGEAK